MSNKKTSIIEECSLCNGTGIYVGYGERDGAGVVCNQCNGTGYIIHTYTEFKGKVKRNDVKRVYLVNPGIVIGEGGGYKLEDFGGVPYEQWWAHGFTKGSEMRKFCCPRWWCQLTGGYSPKLEGCDLMAGQAFSSCHKFAQKEECWKKYDEVKNEEG